jgi:WD40 repeat protein
MMTSANAGHIGGKNQPKARIFISYSRKDSAFAGRLEAGLRARGFDPLMDRTEIFALEDWWKRIETLIVQADTIVFVLSPDAVTSGTCQREVAFAASLNKRLAPIVHRPVEDQAVPAALARLNFIFFDGDDGFDASMDQLAEALETDIHWVRKHTEFGEYARRWAAAGRPGPRGLLLRSPVLEEAERWIASRPEGAPAPTEAAQAFIAESRRAATQRRNILSASLSAGLLMALGLAGFSYWQRTIAAEQRDRALITQSRFLADLANQHNRAKDASTAILLALQAMPDLREGVERPYAHQAEIALYSGRLSLLETSVRAEGKNLGSGNAISPDGLRTVAPYYEYAQVIDIATGKVVFGLGGHNDNVQTAVFSPDGKRIATASMDTTGRIWDAATGDAIAVLEGHRGSVWDIVFSPDGSRLATTSVDKTARVWDAAGKPIAVLMGHEDIVRDAVFSRDGKRLLTTCDDKKVRIWDPENGLQISVLVGHTGALRRAAFSPDGRRVVTASADKTARIWDAETGAALSVLSGHGDQVSNAAFSEDGRRVVTASADKTARIWNAESGELISILAGQELRPLRAAFSADGQSAITVSEDKTIRSWDVDTRKMVKIISRFPERIEGRLERAVFSPDGRRVLLATNNNIPSIRDAETGEVLTVLAGHTRSVLGIAFSPDGRLAATASWDKTARIWDAASGTAIAVLTGHTQAVTSVAFSPDSQRVVTASSDKSARIWNVKTGDQILAISGHTGSVRSAAFSPDGQRVVTASEDSTARIWDSNTGGAIAILKGHRHWVSDAIFSPEGRKVLTASWDTTARIWDAGTGKTLKILSGHRPGEYVWTAAYSPDGRRVATASRDSTVRIWDAETAETAAILAGHDDSVQSAFFSPDGRRILTASWDRTVRIWRVFPEAQDLIADAKQSVPRCLTQAQLEMAFLDPEPPAWCIEMEKWPYDTQAWKDWLKLTRSSLNPPRPDTPQWQPWLDARRAEKTASSSGER